MMPIRYRSDTVLLEDTPLDVGYASEKVALKTTSGEPFRIGGQTGHTQLLLTAPFIDEGLVAQLREIDSLLSLNALGGIAKTLVVASGKHDDPKLAEWRFGIDEDEELGDYYGIRLSNKKFAKTLFVISKDGTVFYHEILNDLNNPFSLDKALVKIAAAQNCYTGKGCHG